MARRAEAPKFNPNVSIADHPPRFMPANDVEGNPASPSEEGVNERAEQLRRNLGIGADGDTNPYEDAQAQVEAMEREAAGNDNVASHHGAGHGHDRPFLGHLWGAGDATFDIIGMFFETLKKWAQESGGIDAGGGSHGKGGDSHGGGTHGGGGKKKDH